MIIFYILNPTPYLNLTSTLLTINKQYLGVWGNKKLIVDLKIKCDTINITFCLLYMLFTKWK